MPKTKANAYTGKIPHPTREAALAHMYGLVRGGASRAVLAVYRCKQDRAHWHVGHKRPAKR